MSAHDNDLSQLIDSSRQDAQAQAAKAKARLDQPVRPPRGKQVATAVLLAAFAAVLLYQYPRFSEPYTWPDPATSTVATEADLVEVVSAIELYRLSQGKYPELLSQVTLPVELAAQVASTVLIYRPGDKSFTLDWTLPQGKATYDSLSENLSVELRAKP